MNLLVPRVSSWWTVCDVMVVCDVISCQEIKTHPAEFLLEATEIPKILLVNDAVLLQWMNLRFRGISWCSALVLDKGHLKKISFLLMTNIHSIAFSWQVYCGIWFINLKAKWIQSCLEVSDLLLVLLVFRFVAKRRENREPSSRMWNVILKN